MTRMARAILLSLLGTASAYTAERPAAAALNQLQLTLVSAKETITEGEPMEITLHVRNVASQKLTANLNLNPARPMPQGRLDFYVKRQGGYDRLNWPADASPGFFLTKETTIEPGAELTRSFVISDALLGGKQVGHAGEMFLIAVYTSSSETGTDRNLRSRPVRVLVDDVPVEERAAYEHYKDLQWAVRAAVDGGPYPGKAQIDRAAEFVERFPESRYERPVRKGLLRILAAQVQSQRATPEEEALLRRLAPIEHR